ncbi:MAG TPA: ATP-binding protein, partial [Flavisolibacter sp.]|nr:ATP-binding protein [Flavisolibacter sp.]
VVDFRYNLTNSAYAAYANTSPEIIHGKKVGDLFPGYFQTSSFTNVVKAFETGVPDTWDIHYNLDGLDIYNTMIATRMDDEVVVHIAEFTKLKNLQLELERKVIELERSNKHLESFAYAASHDLKEPVRKIHVFSGLLSDSLGDRMTEVEKKYFQRLDLASKRMYILIEDLLTYSQVSQKPEEKQPVDLNTTLEHVLGDLDLEIEQKGATIKAGQLYTVSGYPHQLKQVFQNLISNALKYAKPGVPPTISISCDHLRGSDSGLPLTSEEQVKEYCRITVKDNGIGFDQRDAELIFNMFTRLHDGNQTKGTGIGLSIVRKVIENHKGFIWAESQPGEGTRFLILLPNE